MERLEGNVERLERSFSGMRKVVATGMNLIVRIEKNQKELAENQKRTDEKLDRLLNNSLRRRPNGHG